MKPRPITELQNFLKKSSAQCQSEKNWNGKITVDVAADIAADVLKENQKAISLITSVIEKAGLTEAQAADLARAIEHIS